MAAVLPESVLDQNGPRWSIGPFWSKWPYSEPDFSFRETKMDQNGLFWPREVHFGPCRSATVLWPFLRHAFAKSSRYKWEVYHDTFESPTVMGCRDSETSTRLGSLRKVFGGFYPR